VLCSIEQLLKITRLETSPRVEEPCSSPAKDAPRDFEILQIQIFPLSFLSFSPSPLTNLFTTRKRRWSDTTHFTNKLHHTLFTSITSNPSFDQIKTTSAPTSVLLPYKTSKKTFRILLSLSHSHSTSNPHTSLAPPSPFDSRCICLHSSSSQLPLPPSSRLE